MTASVAIAWLILRLVSGTILAAHGSQKLFGWFEGSGLSKWRQGMRAQGFKPADVWAGMNIVGEFGGGLSLIFGFLTPLGAAGAVGAMLMAIIKSHWKNGFFNGKRGIEFPLAVLAIGSAIGLAGPGPISLDSLLRINLPTPLLFIILALVAVVVDVIGVATSHPAPSAGAAPRASA